MRNGYKSVDLWKNNKQHTFYVHKLVASAYLFPPENIDQTFVDHIDGNKQNNNVNNLRWATITENNRNRCKREGTLSAYKGVSLNKYVNKWLAYICIDGRTKHLGYFDNEKEAAYAYNENAKYYFREYANLNNISDDEEEE
jgi:hypothetical protein